MGIFDEAGNIFDFDHNGKLDDFEQAMQMGFLDKMVTEDNDNVELDEDIKEELDLLGIDQMEFELMDEDERRDALEEAGIDLENIIF